MKQSNTQKYILSAILGLVAITGTVLLVNANPDLFKGSLSLNNTQFDPVDITLEVVNCGIEDCSTPSLILNANQKLSEVELIVKNVFDSEVVYADYLEVVEAQERYEIAFSSDICGQYSFDGVTSKYNLAGNQACEPSSYDFIVSGSTANANPPLFTEFASFNLTK